MPLTPETSTFRKHGFHLSRNPTCRELADLWLKRLPILHPLLLLTVSLRTLEVYKSEDRNRPDRHRRDMHSIRPGAATTEVNLIEHISQGTYLYERILLADC